MTVLRSVLLFAVAALAEIGGAWLVLQGVREHRGLAFVGAGILALGLYGFVEMVIFVLILAVGLAYAWKKGALEWV